MLEYDEVYGDESDDLAAERHESLEERVPDDPDADDHSSQGAESSMRVITLADVDPERVQWAWTGRLPLGKLVVLDGDPGAGKSTLCVDLAARITTGSPMPDGDRALGGPADVVYLTAEDGLGDTLRPRLDAARGDPSRFHVLNAVSESDDDGRTTWRPPRIPRDVHHLEELITRTGSVLVVVDVLAAYLDVRDGHADGDVRRGLLPLADLADRTGACVLVIRHLRKSRGSAIYAGGGSIGVIGAARAALLAAADPDDETGQRRVLAVTKCNIAEQAESLAYRLVLAEDHGCARLVWDGPTTHRADDLLAISDPQDSSDATDVLADLLGDGPIWVKDAFEQMGAAGFSKDQAKRAKKKLHARSVKVGKPGDPGSGWKWELPRREHEESEECGDSDPTPLAPLALPSQPDEQVNGTGT